MRTILYLVSLLPTTSGMTHGSWQSLAPGMDNGMFHASKLNSSGDSLITVLRIDPEIWSLEFTGLSLTDRSRGLTARQWSKTYGLAAAINAVMFATDNRTHVGYLRFRIT
jgi:hypothetical protein